MRYFRGSSLLLVSLLTASTPAAQDRPRLFLTVNDAAIPPAAQPRVVLEQQRGAVDIARIRVTGTAGLEYAGGISPGDPVEIAMQSQLRTATVLFSGEVVSVERDVDSTQPAFVISAANEVPRTDGAAPAAIRIDHDGSGSDARLVAFLAGLSSTSSLQGVLVIGIDAATGAPMTGRAVAPAILLGEGSGEPFGATLTVNVSERFSSVDEANALARRILAEQLASRVSAEVLTDGIPGIEPGTTVELHGAGDSFDGAYVVTAVQHRIDPGSNGGYSSVLRIRRADLGMFFLPGVDDEVLVSFEHGDFSRPVFFGSWWGCDAKPQPGRSDDSDHCRLLHRPW